ncbi:MAG: nucleoside deaminase [Bacteroidota bacterium]|jgi:tRNA(adenine34) deaminase|nr:nucleoside deaminase [Bacteroidota bacterium]MEC8615684.1 nucleoside deaminase [Bacteroidota bacterium]
MRIKFNDEYYMKLAYKYAKLAYEKDEVPVGAVIVKNNIVLAKSYNLVETLTDVTAHAEMISITSATNKINSKYLVGCTLYVTLEPCVMCFEALIMSRISKIVYSVSDPKKGGISTQLKKKHKILISSGILQKKSLDLIQRFFKKKRIKFF